MRNGRHAATVVAPLSAGAASALILVGCGGGQSEVPGSEEVIVYNPDDDLSVR